MVVFADEPHVAALVMRHRRQESRHTASLGAHMTSCRWLGVEWCQRRVSHCARPDR